MDGSSRSSRSSSRSFYKSTRLCNNKVMMSTAPLQLQVVVLLLLLGFIWFLLLGVVDSTTTPTLLPSPPPSSSSSEELVVVMSSSNHHDQVITGGSSRLLRQLSPSHHHHKRMERLKFVSKRRVPNGPDPIHNRRAGNSNQPPGRSQGVVSAEIKGRRQ